MVASSSSCALAGRSNREIKAAVKAMAWTLRETLKEKQAWAEKLLQEESMFFKIHKKMIFNELEFLWYYLKDTNSYIKRQNNYDVGKAITKGGSSAFMIHLSLKTVKNEKLSQLWKEIVQSRLLQSS